MCKGGLTPRTFDSIEGYDEGGRIDDAITRKLHEVED
jgi:hypothetical protein